MTRTFLLLALVAVNACGTNDAPPPPPKELPELAQRVGRAMGLDAWRGLGRLRFTWKHVSKGLARSYDWRPREGTVRVQIGTIASGQSSQTIRSGPLPADAPDNERKLHQAWVNDSYWLLLPLLLFDDGSQVTDRGETKVPGMHGLGSVRALEVRYPADEGYTGGDRYVLYIGEDDLPVAWSFFRADEENPKLVTTRGPRRLANGISLPERFEAADGKTVIAISDVTAEPAG